MKRVKAHDCKYIYGNADSNAKVLYTKDDLYDGDKDGWPKSKDCDDNDPNRHPGTKEIANNNVDENCDGIVLEIDVDQDGIHPFRR